MKNFWNEFKNFAAKGNAFDLAVAVVVGAAFTGVVNSLVADIITPLLSFITPSSGDIKNLAITLWPAHMQNGTTTAAVVMRYGNFLQTLINFLLVSISIFAIFKLITMARKSLFRKGENAVPEHEKPPQERLLEEIRDLLKEGK